MSDPTPWPHPRHTELPSIASLSATARGAVRSTRRGGRAPRFPNPRCRPCRASRPRGGAAAPPSGGASARRATPRPARLPSTPGERRRARATGATHTHPPVCGGAPRPATRAPVARHAAAPAAGVVHHAAAGIANGTRRPPPPPLIPRWRPPLDLTATHHTAAGRRRPRVAARRVENPTPPPPRAAGAAVDHRSSPTLAAAAGPLSRRRGRSPDERRRDGSRLPRQWRGGGGGPSTRRSGPPRARVARVDQPALYAAGTLSTRQRSSASRERGHAVGPWTSSVLAGAWAVGGAPPRTLCGTGPQIHRAQGRPPAGSDSQPRAPRCTEWVTGFVRCTPAVITRRLLIGRGRRRRRGRIPPSGTRRPLHHARAVGAAPPPRARRRRVDGAVGPRSAAAAANPSTTPFLPAAALPPLPPAFPMGERNPASPTA